MVDKISENPTTYPDCAREQFFLRFGLVEADLHTLLKSLFKHHRSQTPNCR